MTGDVKGLYPFKNNFIRVKNYNYHYVDEGRGKAVVMIHGNPTWSFMYRELVKDLSATRRVIAPDHLGCGFSDKPQDFEYRLETHIDNLETFMLSLKLENVTLVMHDWGAAIGMGFAERHQQMISGLVILNSSAFTMDAMPWRIRLCRVPWLGETLIRKFNLFSLAATRMTTVRKLDETVRKGYLAPYGSPANRVAVNRFVQDIPMSPEDPSYETLVQIERGLWLFRELPVCLVWGMRDWCFHKKFLDKWRLFYPQAEVNLFEDAGHLVMEDACADVKKCVKAFLDKNEL